MKAETKKLWFSRRALWAHFAVFVFAPACVALADWQVHRAISGNFLSYFYAVEWPVFAVLSFVFWWYYIHDDPEKTGARGLRRATESALARNELKLQARARQREEEDEKLRAYNDYLEQLARLDADQAGDGSRSRHRV